MRELVRSKETGKVLDLEGDTIATAQLAVDRHKEHRQVTPRPRDFEVIGSAPTAMDVKGTARCLRGRMGSHGWHSGGDSLSVQRGRND
jgi:hypothetical protein